MKRRLCLAGKNRIAVETLQILRDSCLFDLSVCPVQTDVGQDGWQPSLRKAANDFQVPLTTLGEVCEEPEIIFLSVEFDKIIRTVKFTNALLLNVHFSLLPAYKGCFTSIWPLYFGEEKTGVTLHYIDDGIDTGDIIDQEAIAITASTTARELYEKYQDVGLSVIKRNIEKNGMTHFAARQQQDAAGSTYFSRNSLAKIGNQINYRATAAQINNQVRSLFFPEYQTAMLNNEKLARCEITKLRSFLPPGSVLRETDTEIHLATVDYDVILHKWLD